MAIHGARDVALTSASVVSACCSVFVIATFLRYRSLRRHPSQLIVSRSVLDLIFSLCTLHHALYPLLALCAHA